VSERNLKEPNESGVRGGKNGRGEFWMLLIKNHKPNNEGKETTKIPRSSHSRGYPEEKGAHWAGGRNGKKRK